MEILCNLDQDISIPSNGTYRVRYEFWVEYALPQEETYLNFTFGPHTLGFGGEDAPVSGTHYVYDENLAFTAGTHTLHFHVSTFGFGFDNFSLWLDNVSVKQLLPPLKVTTPDPVNSAPDIPLDQVLSWVAGAGGADSYDVYFGTNPDPSGDFKGNQPGLTYDPPGDLEGGQTYYWRIDAKNAYGTTTGDVWEFTTVAGLLAPDKTHFRYG